MSITENFPSTLTTHTAQKNEVSIKDFFSRCDQIRRFLRIWYYLLKKSLMENFIFLCSDSIANSDPNLHEISSKDFGITKLKYLTIAPTSQVNNYFGSEG